MKEQEAQLSQTDRAFFQLYAEDVILNLLLDFLFCLKCL